MEIIALEPRKALNKAFLNIKPQKEYLIKRKYDF